MHVEYQRPRPDLVSQARPTSTKKVKGLVNCVYKPCPTTLYSAVQSCCSILSHDALQHCLSCNNSLEYGERELGHLSRYCRNCKNTKGSMLIPQQVIQEWFIWNLLRHPSNCIPVGHSLYFQFTRPFPSFVEVGLPRETSPAWQASP